MLGLVVLRSSSFWWKNEMFCWLGLNLLGGLQREKIKEMEKAESKKKIIKIKVKKKSKNGVYKEMEVDSRSSIFVRKSAWFVWQGTRAK